MDHQMHEGHSANDFQRRFWFSLILTIPVLVFSKTFQELFGFQPKTNIFTDWLPFILGTTILIYSGTIFLKGAYLEIKNRMPGMMTLVSIAILASYIYSFATIFFISGQEFFWELSTLITIMLLGHYLEMKSIARAKGALGELAKLLPDTAELIYSDLIEEVPIRELNVGDFILVRSGARVPADGVVIEGESETDEGAFSGESKPVLKIIGSNVIAGTINIGGALKIRVTSVGENMVISGIMRLVSEAQASKSKVQVLADRAAYYLVIIAIFSGTITFIFWLSYGTGLNIALERLVAVLIIACPHALGLAVPLVSSISTSIAARNGILVRNRLDLEKARRADIVLFDKTGTLTFGKVAVIDIWPASPSLGGATQGRTLSEVISLAASVEYLSEHAVGRAIVSAAEDLKVYIDKIDKFETLPGRGVRAMIGSKTIVAGGAVLVNFDKNILSVDLQNNIDLANKDGKTVVYILEDGQIVGVVTIADQIRPESSVAVKMLKSMGLEVVMITGDSTAAAGFVARELGIEQYFAEIMPEEKVAKVKALQKEGKVVMMVGDGVNDAPALAAADIGVAIGAGTDVAINSAGIMLVKNNPLDIVKIIKLSRATYRKMTQNLVWATGYNIVAIPLAAGVLISYGITLIPSVGAILMSLSTVIVALNARRLIHLNLN